MTVSTAQRRESIGRYVDVVHQIGRAVIHRQSLRDHLIVDGVDFWSASPLRESSPWSSPIFSRLDVLLERAASVLDGVDSSSSDVKQMPTQRISRSRVWGYWCASAFSSLWNRTRRVGGNVVFVVFLPESNTPTSDKEVVARYFGQLPEHAKSMGLAPVVVFLPTNSRPASMTKGERRTWRTMRCEMSSVPITSFVTPRTVWQSWKLWRRLQRQAPSSFDVSSALKPNLKALWPRFESDFEHSVRGTASVRSAMLAVGFRSAIKAVRGARLVVYPFEGQGWESLLERACSAENVPSIAYLHTIMKPWDLRAHTALREVPPRILALHGDHDRSELQAVAGIAESNSKTLTVPVEALRYGYLANSTMSQSRVLLEIQVLVVMGSDCKNSNHQFAAIIDEIRRQGKPWKIQVKTHPQCPSTASIGPETQVVSGSLHEAFAESSAVFLCGTAAPLDSYLYGLPTAALIDDSGYSMNPLEPDDSYFVGKTPAEVVAWLTSAMVGPRRVPSAERFFDLSPGFAKWEKIIHDALTAHR